MRAGPWRRAHGAPRCGSGCAEALHSPARPAAPSSRCVWLAAAAARPPSRARAAPPLAGRAPPAACRPWGAGRAPAKQARHWSKGLAGRPVGMQSCQTLPPHNCDGSIRCRSACALPLRQSCNLPLSARLPTHPKVLLTRLAPPPAARSLVACKCVDDLLQRVAGVVSCRRALPPAAVRRSHNLHLRLPRSEMRDRLNRSGKCGSPRHWVCTAFACANQTLQTAGTRAHASARVRPALCTHASPAQQPVRLCCKVGVV